MAVFTPGNGIDTVTVDSGDLQNTDSSLVGIDGGLIVDLVGNTISIGGGIEGGDDVTPVTWE